MLADEERSTAHTTTKTAPVARIYLWSTTNSGGPGCYGSICELRQLVTHGIGRHRRTRRKAKLVEDIGDVAGYGAGSD